MVLSYLVGGVKRARIGFRVMVGIFAELQAVGEFRLPLPSVPSKGQPNHSILFRLEHKIQGSRSTGIIFGSWREGRVVPSPGVPIVSQLSSQSNVLLVDRTQGVAYVRGLHNDTTEPP